MNSVYFPVQIVVLFRRLVNVISTLSISNQYLLLTRQSSRFEEGEAVNTTAAVQQARKFGSFSWSVLEWPWLTWTWRRLVVFENTAKLLGQPADAFQEGTTLKVLPDITFPWFGQSWPWISSNTIHIQNTPPEDATPPQSQRRTVPSSKGTARLPDTNPDPTTGTHSDFPDIIHSLLKNPALYGPTRTPRNPIVLCHGLYGFDVRGPASFPILRMHYWSSVLSILRETVGAEVIVTSVPGTGSITSRAETLHRQLQDKANGREVNFLAHSMGGLDCRHLISHVKPKHYTPLSLTTISTPHRGSPFMDWCVDNIGIGKLREKENIDIKAIPDLSLPSSPSPSSYLANPVTPLTSNKPDMHTSHPLASLPSSFTTLLLSIVDSPAYSNLTTSYLTRVFNPMTPDDPRVRYFSVAARLAGVSVWHPLWLPKTVLDGVEGRLRQQSREDWEREHGEYIDSTTTGKGSEGGKPFGKEDGAKPLWAREDEWGNDGLVTVQSARWGEFLGTLEGCDHWAVRGARGIELGVDLKAVGGSMGGNGGDGWGLKDWGRLVGAWRREERQAAAASRSDGGGGTASNRMAGKEQERVDEAFKSSTEKLSAVFDWLAEQAPLTGKGKGSADGVVGGKEAKKRDLESKMDLERFYVALSRKLYDEGL